MNYITSMFGWIFYIMNNIKIPFPITTDFVPMFSIFQLFVAWVVISIVIIVIKFILIPAFIPTVTEENELISDGDKQIQVKRVSSSRRVFGRTKTSSQIVSHRSERRK